MFPWIVETFHKNFEKKYFWPISTESALFISPKYINKLLSFLNGEERLAWNELRGTFNQLFPQISVVSKERHNLPKIDWLINN